MSDDLVDEPGSSKLLSAKSSKSPLHSADQAAVVEQDDAIV